MNCYNINSFLQKWEVLYISKKEPKTYNHYVPQFYSKNFSGNNSIGVYNFERNKFIDEAAIRKVGGKDHLYGKDQCLEDWFQNLEGHWSIVVNDILRTEKIPQDSTQYTYLLMFVYLSDVRVAEVADKYHDFKLQEGKNVARILKEQGKLNLSEDFIDNLTLEIDRPNLVYIQGMPKMIRIISGLTPLLIINESKVDFITSDVPVTKYNKWFIERNYKHPCGFGHMGAQCFIPLSPKICFCLYDDIVYQNKYSKKDRIRIYDDETIMEFNRLFVENSYKEIYYEKAMHEKLNQIVHDKKAIEGDVWNIGNPQTGYLQRISNRGVYKNRYFPMFKVRSFFKTAPFPYGDERGPLRKEAYEILNEKK